MVNNRHRDRSSKPIYGEVQLRLSAPPLQSPSDVGAQCSAECCSVRGLKLRFCEVRCPDREARVSNVLQDLVLFD